MDEPPPLIFLLRLIPYWFWQGFLQPDALPDTNPFCLSGLGTGTHKGWLAPQLAFTMGNQGKVHCLMEQRASREGIM